MTGTQTARQLIESDRILNRPWLMEAKAFRAMVARAVSSPVMVWDDDEEDDEEDPRERDYPVTEDGIACLSVSGPLVSKSYWYTTYSEVAQMAKDAYADESVKGVLWAWDSPGGEACSDWTETTGLLRQLATTKPTAAISKDSCYSAAYCLASTAPKLFVTNLGGTGSIGCWSAHVDLSKAYEQEGVKVTLIFAGSRKVDGNPYEPLSDPAEKDMQDECDRIRNIFVAEVAKSRGVSADALMATEARCYMGADGIPLVCDAVGGVDDALGYLRGQIGAIASPKADDEGKDPPGDMMMASGGVVVQASEPIVVGVGQDCQITSLLFNGQVIDPSSYSVANGTHGGVSITYVSPTAERFISKLLPGLIQQSMDRMASEHMPSLKQLAFGKNAGGHADHEWSDNESLDLFGQKGVVLAVRGFGERSASATDTSRRISMLVAPYDGKLSTNLGGFREIYQRGAFAQGLDNDPRALFNHDEACILGRKSAGTAKFWEDAEGVHVECDAPETQWADDLLVSMRRGDITQSSAAFWILQQRWETRDGERVRIVEKALLREASVYSFPAYETATASVQPVAAEILSHATNELDGARLRVLRLR